MKRKIPQVPITTGVIPFFGGLDTTSSSMFAKVGTCSVSKNVYQGVKGGYVVTGGYERFDGSSKPSMASYAILPVSSLPNCSVGDTVTDGTETAVVLLVTNEHLVIWDYSGPFTPGDILVGSTVVGRSTATQSAGGADSTALDVEYQLLAANARRAEILSPPGSGRTLGGKYYDGALYVFRDNELGTAANMWKSTESGWEAVNLGRELVFTSGGTFEPADGDLIIGATSGATATIARVVHESGSWAAGDAVGRFILADTVGVFASAELLTIDGHVNASTASGADTAISLLPGGNFEFVIANFTGSVSTKRLYGVDGVNRGFEFDGTVFVPIKTGMVNDAPEHIAAHTNHLFFSFSGSLQHSGTGTPYQWIPYLGAAEIGMGDVITGFVSQTGSDSSPVLAVFSVNGISMLYGSSRDDWKMVAFRTEAGAYAGSMQRVGQTFFMDDRGVSTLSATQAYGNFASASVSANVDDFVKARRSTLTCSTVMRDKNIYCLFFSDGSALYSTVVATKNGSAVSALMPMEFPVFVRWIDSAEGASGEELIYFGDTEGVVYQLESGKTFDGGNINWTFETHYVDFMSPQTLKKFRRCFLDMDSDGYGLFSFSYKIGNGSVDIEQGQFTPLVVEQTAPTFDNAFFDSFYFDGIPETPSDMVLYGNAENISLVLSGDNKFSAPFSFNGAHVMYSLTRVKR